MKIGHILGIALCVAASCRKDTFPKETAQPQSESPKAAGANEASLVPETEARALIDEWLRTQNTGDLAAYQGLYAKRFDGIKRAGPRTRRFDRAGWLADRARMFERPARGNPMHVEIEGLALNRSATTVRARFQQAFARGEFSDRGPKELFLVRDGRALRIAREEMLASELQGRSAAPELAAAERGFFFVIQEGVVLSRNAGRMAARGPLTLLSEANEIYKVRSAVDEDKIDETLRQWKGRKVQIFDADGPTCVATVGDLSLLVRVDPHFSTTQMWQGLVNAQGDPLEDGKPLTKDKVAKEAWDMAEPILVAKLRGDCKIPTSEEAENVVWARPVELSAPAFGAVKDVADTSLAAMAEKEARRRPEVVAAFKNAAEPTFEMKAVTNKDGNVALIVARFQSGGTCADFIGMTFIWRIAGTKQRPQLQLLNDPSSYSLFMPSAAFDLDGDGHLELLGGTGGIGGPGEFQLVRPGNGYGDSDALGVTSLDCYC